MNTITNFVNNIPMSTSSSTITKLLGICPSITVIHDALRRADEDIMNGILDTNTTYNKYVVNVHRPQNRGELFEEVLANLSLEENVKQAYWRACWYWNGGEFYFRYPSRLQVAAMMFRC